MPIKDLSDSVRLPRLGKIHLGYKHPEKGYPVKTDYFVFPKDHSDYDALVKVFGEKPKELRILIPVEDEELWATQYYRAYNLTYGLVCKGDGENATRMVDVNTGFLPGKDTSTVTMKEMTCLGKSCPEYENKKCREVMNFRFILPEVPGLGVWQIDTGSINSIVNINSCAKLIKQAFGRISLIPLKLTFEPQESNNPETGKKQTVYVMHLRSNVTVAQLADAAREQSKTLMLPDLEEVYGQQVQQDIEQLWEDNHSKVVASTNVKAKAEISNPVTNEITTPTIIPVKKRSSSRSHKTTSAGSAPVPVTNEITEASKPSEMPPESQSEGDKAKAKASSSTPKTKRDPSTIKTLAQLNKALLDDFGLQPKQQLAELNLTSWTMLAITPAEAYTQITSTWEDH